MSSVSSQLPQVTCIWGAYLHSAHVQPASQRGDFGPKASATQLAGMHLVGSRASGTLSRQPDGSRGESQEPPLGNKAAVPLQTDRELHWPLSLKLACGCHAKTQGCPPRAMLRPVCHPVVPGGDCRTPCCPHTRRQSWLPGQQPRLLHKGDRESGSSATSAYMRWVDGTGTAASLCCCPHRCAAAAGLV